MTGVPLNLIRSNDFAQVGFDLAEDLGSWPAAILLSRIVYRTGTEGGWWEVTKADMQAECRLSEWEIRQAINLLLERGFIEWERIGPDSNKRRIRPVIMRNPHEVVRDSHDGHEESSRTSTKKVITPTPPTPPPGGEGARKSRTSYDYTPEFAEFWDLYPNKTGKPSAFRAWKAAVKRAGDRTCILAGLRAHLPSIEAKRDRGYFLTAARWLNDDGWNNELDPLRHQRETREQRLIREGWR